MPLIAEPDGLMGAPMFAAIPLGVRIINTARGEIINESRPFKALRSGQVTASGLDVFAHEPVTAAPGKNPAREAK